MGFEKPAILCANKLFVCRHLVFCARSEPGLTWLAANDMFVVRKSSFIQYEKVIGSNPFLL